MHKLPGYKAKTVMEGDGHQSYYRQIHLGCCGLISYTLDERSNIYVHGGSPHIYAVLSENLAEITFSYSSKCPSGRLPSP
jgi:hypothetical protein